MKILLGQYLFYSTELSFNNTRSCASCHDPKFAFTDGYRKSITASGDRVMHNAPTLFNTANYKHFDLANPILHSLVQQHKRPLLGDNPVEMGFHLNEKKCINNLLENVEIKKMVSTLYSKNIKDFNSKSILECIALFVSTLESKNAKYDRYVSGNSTVFNASEKRGMELFFSPKLHCSECHAPPHFTSSMFATPDSVYFNIGLYNTDGKGAYLQSDYGLYNFTKVSADMGKFKAPSLRNIALTAPYFHDGSGENLTAVIDVYVQGGRANKGKTGFGDGRENPFKDKRITGLSLSESDRKALIDFLFCLTDSSSLQRAEFQRPVKAD